MGEAKRSYTISCSSDFRDKILALAEKRGVNAADLARSLLLLLPEAVLDAAPDPGEPPPGDREDVVLKTGKSQGQRQRRKPRLQVRLPGAVDPVRIRKALGLALRLEAGESLAEVLSPPTPPPVTENPEHLHEISRLKEEVGRLRSMVSVLCFDPLPDGITSREEALHIMGFPPYSEPDSRELRARFRLLATIHHPDGVLGDHARMSQLNAAFDFLRY